MTNNILQVHIILNNENLFLEVESQDDISLTVEVLERFYKKNNKNKKPHPDLKEVQVSKLEPRSPTPE